MTFGKTIKIALPLKEGNPTRVVVATIYDVIGDAVLCNLYVILMRQISVVK